MCTNRKHPDWNRNSRKLNALHQNERPVLLEKLEGKFHTFSMKSQHKFSWPECLFVLGWKQLFNYIQRTSAAWAQNFMAPQNFPENFPHPSQQKTSRQGGTRVERRAGATCMSGSVPAKFIAKSQSTWCMQRCTFFLQALCGDAKMSCDLVMVKCCHHEVGCAADLSGRGNSLDSN